MARRPRDRGRGQAMSDSALFTKIRNALVSVGRSERTATRKGRRLVAAPFADFVRLTPEQNVKLGLSRKARHYVLKDVKRLSKATPTISARQFETNRARELYRLTPEQTTEARRHGAIRYVSADQRERVAKAASPAKKRRSSLRSRSFALLVSMFRVIRRTSAATGGRTRSCRVRVSATANCGA
jgi:hypothetical protein